jgi:hypothetical protein
VLDARNASRIHHTTARRLLEIWGLTRRTNMSARLGKFGSRGVTRRYLRANEARSMSYRDRGTARFGARGQIAEMAARAGIVQGQSFELPWVVAF